MTEMLPEYGGCLWPADPACLGDKWDALDDSVRDRALALASSTLRRLTAYRVGGCPVTIRPVIRRGCWNSYMTYESDWMRPQINASGQWVNNGGGGSACEIALPAPVGRIDEIRVDGIALFSTDYDIQNGNILVWMGAGPCPFFTS